jgi:hypothetical protein
MLEFGERHPDFDVLVFNEREVRAAAGIIFVVAFAAFMNGWLVGNNEPTKLMVSAFLIDFFIRIFVSPKYAPSMIIGRWFVNDQTPEFIGAPQKRWAWAIGFGLACIMFHLVVLNDIRGPVNIITCAFCLGLLFFESAFGICVGCKIYNLFHKEKAKYCAGGVCESPKMRHAIQKIGANQLAVLLVFVVSLFFIPLVETKVKGHFVNSSKVQDCTVPKWAIDMGHEEKWKLHNGCK